MSNASAPPTVPPDTLVTEVDENDSPRTNDLINGKRFKLNLKNTNKVVQVERVFEKVRNGGWFVCFRNPQTNRLNTLDMDTFFDHASMADRVWLGEEDLL